MDPANMEMTSLMDLNTYFLPNEVLTGNDIKPLETEYFRQAKLGEGPNSIVYKVKEKESNKIYAVKIIQRKALETSIPKEIFREITLLKNLNHDNVIKLYDVFRDANPSSLLLVFELCSYDLHYYLHNYPEPMRHDHLKCISRQLFRGLNYLHKNYIVHRDIKPSNLLVSESGQLKISDFGLCRRFSHLNRPSTPGAMTRYYQAPEMLLGAPSYNEKVDIWSAGCVIVELMTKKPFLQSESDLHHINLMISVMGRPTNAIWPGFGECRYSSRVNLSQAATYNLLTDHLQKLGCGPAYELLKEVLVYNPDVRASAYTCVNHDWFESAPFASESIELPSPSKSVYKALM